MVDKVREKANKRRAEIQNKKRKIVTAIISVIILIVFCIIYTSLIRPKKVVETGGQPMEEQNDEFIEQDILNNEIEDDPTKPLDENVVNENEIKESKVTNEKEITENTNKYYIKINNQMNTVTIYTKNSDGNYTVPVKAMVCSIGTATPTGGKYKMTGVKHSFHTLFGHTPGTYVYGQYSTSIVGNILFHSVPYTIKGDPSTLEYWEYDKLGTKASAGCIRLTVRDAKWIYDNISKGTIVEFYYNSNPGPLGKPSAQKISGNVDCRGWDPTDPNPNNPWKKGKKQNTENKNEQKQNNQVEKNQNMQNINSTNKNNVNNQNNQNTNVQDENKLSTNKQNINMQNTNTQSTNEQNTNAKNNDTQNLKTKSKQINTNDV